MRPITLISVIASLFVGIVIGLGTGYSIYQPKIRTFESQTTSLIAEIIGLNQSIFDKNNRLSAQIAQVSGLETAKSELQTKLNTAEDESRAFWAQATSLNSQLSNLTSHASSLQKQMDSILGITVNQNYRWDYGRQAWEWEVPIPLSVYVEYRDMQRPRSGAYYVNMAKDPGDDAYIDQMVKKINELAAKENLTEVQKLNLVITFVQSLPYTVDKETTPYDEYPRYPVETLFARGGDCEDTSILVAALLDRMDYDVALLLLRDAQHMAVGVALPDGQGSYYENNGKKYFFLETTGEDWEIGQMPPDFIKIKAAVYPVRS